MKKVEISEQLLRDWYKDASHSVQLQMEKEIGKEIFDPIYCIKSYGDACVDLGLVPLSDYDLFKRYNSEKEISFHKLLIISKAINKNSIGGDIDLMYFPAFKIDVSGNFVYDGVFTREKRTSKAGCYMPIFYQSEDAAEYAGKTFTDLYKKLSI